MMTAKQRFLRCVLATGIAVGCPWGLGCAVDLADVLAWPDDATSPTDITPSGEGDDTTLEVVTIRFRNLTADEAVNVEFHASQEPLESLPEDLFAEEYLVTTSIGIAGTGIIRPWQEDVIEFSCTANLTIGTPGGSFVDDESGEPRGIGVPRWVQEGPLALCGSVVTFEFSGDGIDFTTSLIIGR